MYSNNNNSNNNVIHNKESSSSSSGKVLLHLLVLLLATLLILNLIVSSFLVSNNNNENHHHHHDYALDTNNLIVKPVNNNNSNDDGYNNNQVVNPNDYTIEERERLNFQADRREKILKLPAPILLMGFPKGGTTSIDNYFRCSGLHVSHNLCHNNPVRRGKMKLCGDLMFQNIQNGRPILENTGDYDLYSQFEEIDLCIFPQVQYLDEIHKQHPEATFIMNKRNVESWVKSVMNWRAWGSSYVPLGVRMTRCSHILKDMDIEIKNNSTVREDQLRALYHAQLDRVRAFVEKYPSHHLIEVDIDGPDAEEILSKAFIKTNEFQNPQGGAKSCWGARNKKKKKAHEDLIRPVDKKYHAALMETRKTYFHNEKIPIIVVGLTDDDAYSVHEFFRYYKFRSSGQICKFSAYSQTNRHPPCEFYCNHFVEREKCSLLAWHNLQKNQPMLDYMADTEVYTSLHDFERCFFPQIHHLGEMYQSYPHATLILNLRDVEKWNESNIPIDDRILNCLGVHPNGNSKLDSLRKVYEEHVQRIRDFVRNHPSLTLLEVHTDQPVAAKVLFEKVLVENDLAFTLQSWKPPTTSYADCDHCIAANPKQVKMLKAVYIDGVPKISKPLFS